MRDFLRRFVPTVMSPRAHKSAGLEEKQIINPLIALHGFGGASWSGGEPSSLAREGYLKNPIVHRCVRMLSEAAASIPLVLYEGEEELTQHPFLNLLAVPNNRQSGQLFLQTIYSNLLVSGNSYVLKITLDSALSELHILRSDSVTPVLGSDGWPIAFDYRLATGTTRYQVSENDEQVLHIALYNPLCEVEGVSPLCSAHMALDIHNAASKWNKALLDNSARPSGALIYSAGESQNLTEEQFDRLKNELEDGYSGTSRAGRPMLLEGGLDWKAMGLAPKDMDFIEAKNGAAREIALAFGVPPMLLGIPGDNTYANYAEANRTFWRQTVLPMVGHVNASLQHWLSHHWSKNLRLDVDRDQIQGLNLDREALWKRVQAAEFLTINEKRLACGYGALPDREVEQLGANQSSTNHAT